MITDPIEKTLHAMNNCIGTIQINLDLITESDTIDPSLKEAAEASQRQATRLATLVQELHSLIPGGEKK